MAGAAAIGTAPPADAGPFDLPSIDRIVHYQPKLPLAVYTADGIDIARFGAEHRVYTPLARIPKLMQDALLAVEDTRFREHGGIDPTGIARAAIAMVTGGRRQGASTITQQLVRTMLLTREFTAERKGKEILLALKVEQQLSKDRVLEIYMNEIYLGQRAYGFAAAAQTYFGKPLDKLSIAETAMLAGLPQNPAYANPITNFERAQARQRLVIERMRSTGVITDAQAAKARDEQLSIRLAAQQDVHAGHVAELARRAVIDRFGTAAYDQGIQVYTTLRAADQEAAHRAVRRGVLAHDRKGAWRGPEGTETLPEQGDAAAIERAAAQALKDRDDDDQLRLAVVLDATPKSVVAQLASGERVVVSGAGLAWARAGLAPGAKAPLKVQRGSVLRLVQQGDGWAISQWPQVEAALVALEPATGRVRALVGGFDFDRQPLNHVTQALRQPGSSFKPILMSAALEAGVMPATVIDDAPISIPLPGQPAWSPGNSDGRFDGPLTLREALAKSRNTVSVRVVQQVGSAPVRAWAGRFGLDAARQPDNLTIALGTGSVTPMQMAQAYSVFANGGWRAAPVLIDRITDAQGKVLFQNPPPPAFTEDTRAIPERNAFVMSSMLNDVTRIGTAAKAQAQLRRSDLYGKTGTTSDAVDAWFAGWQPKLVTVVWLGHDQPKSLGEHESGGGLALPIWIDFMGQALKGVPVAPAAPTPAGLVREGDWVYDDWAARGGWVQRIEADGRVTRAPGAGEQPAVPATSSSTAPTMPGAAPASPMPAPMPGPASPAPRPTPPRPPASLPGLPPDLSLGRMTG